MTIFDDPRLSPLQREDREMVGGLVAVLAMLMVSCVVWFGWQKRQLTEVDLVSARVADATPPFGSQDFPKIQIDINEAAWAELALLPGVGEVLARRIVRFRETEGRIESVDRLADVKGIGPKLMLGIRPMVRDPSQQNSEKDPS